jgi:hypothetical protein
VTARTSRDRARGRAFRPLGATRATATPASTQRWFVTAHSTRPQLVRGQLVEWPASLVHAKQMGSTATACGLPAWNWPRFFHLSFPAARTETCRDCLAAVRT